MKKIVLTTVLILGIIPVCLADSLTGIVKDKLTGETLIGTVVQVKGEKHHATSTGLDGSFVLKDLPNEGYITLIAAILVINPRRFRWICPQESLSIWSWNPNYKN